MTAEPLEGGAWAKVRRTVQSISATATFRKIGPVIVPRLDRFLHRVSGGSFMLAQRVVPSLMLTTTGVRSGELRDAPLACLPRPDGSFVVVGSNFGRAHHPAWTTNLIAHPAATVTYRSRQVAVVGNLLQGDERAPVWAAACEAWPAYERYAEESGRELRVFVLTPVSP